MATEIRTVAPGEAFEAAKLFSDAILLKRPTPERFEARRASWEPGRSHAAFEGGRMVGHAGAFSFELTVPGGARAPVAGVSRVGVLPTHTRRGILRSLMAAQLADVHGRGEPFALLWASESVIYGRFGYGMCHQDARYTVPTSRSAFTMPTPVPGSLRMHQFDDVAADLPAVFDRAARGRAGSVGRPDWWWDWFRGAGTLDTQEYRWVVFHDGPGGVPDGCALYCTPHRDDWEHHGQPLRVDELWADDPAVRLALWRYLLDIDLAETLTTRWFPADEVLALALADPRRAKVEVSDGAWLRVVDPVAALSARRYAGGPGHLVIELVDPLCPWAAGAFELDVDATGQAACRRVHHTQPDLTAHAADLGAAYLGGTPWRSLAAAGRAHEHTPGAAAHADRLFTTWPAPWVNTFF